jgi:hypothetical protein
LSCLFPAGSVARKAQGVLMILSIARDFCMFSLNIRQIDEDTLFDF